MCCKSFLHEVYLNPRRNGELQPKECKKHRKPPEIMKTQILSPSLCPSSESMWAPHATEIKARTQTPLTQLPTISFAACWSNFAALSGYLSQKHCTERLCVDTQIQPYVNLAWTHQADASQQNSTVCAPKGSSLCPGEEHTRAEFLVGVLGYHNPPVDDGL